MSRASIIILGTCDTKLEELLFVRDQVLLNDSCEVELWDVGYKDVSHEKITVHHKDILKEYGTKKSGVNPSTLDRGEYVLHMIEAVTEHLRERLTRSPVHGFIAIGGSSGTSICSAIMRNAVQIGVPKLIVSTMASGDIAPYIDCTDITMMYSIVDIAGLNFLSEQILGNAAAAIVGMAAAYQQRSMAHSENKSCQKRRRRVGLTMFGVTTPACDRIRKALTEDHGCEVIVFHCTGAGGRAMERLVKEKTLDAVVDLTTTEIADELVGGVLTAGADRLTAAAEAGIPQIISVGACDMVNFGPRDSVPKKWEEQGRKLYVHNPAVTLMRTNAEECQRIGEFIAKTLRDKAVNPAAVKILLPTGGVSIISTNGGVFEDVEADETLFRAIEDGLSLTGISVKRDDRAINDDGFADLVVDTITSML